VGLARDHSLYALADGFVRFEDHGARERLVSVVPAAS
jgi:ribosomal protein L27